MMAMDFEKGGYLHGQATMNLLWPIVSAPRIFLGAPCLLKNGFTRVDYLYYEVRGGAHRPGTRLLLRNKICDGPRQRRFPIINGPFWGGDRGSCQQLSGVDKMSQRSRIVHRYVRCQLDCVIGDWGKPVDEAQRRIPNARRNGAGGGGSWVLVTLVHLSAI